VLPSDSISRKLAILTGASLIVFSAAGSTTGSTIGATLATGVAGAAGAAGVAEVTGQDVARGPVESGADIARALPSVSAQHVRSHEPSGREMMKAGIDLSPEGLRVRQSGSNRSLEMVQDFNAGRAWLVDSGRRVAHEVPLIPGSELERQSAPVTGTFLGQRPCAIGLPHHTANGRWRGRRVEIHHCLDADRSVLAIEFLDTEFSLISYRKTATGFVDELRNLKARVHSIENFRPPSHFRLVDKRELFHGAPALGVFKDSKPD